MKARIVIAVDIPERQWKQVNDRAYGLTEQETIELWVETCVGLTDDTKIIEESSLIV